MKKMLLSGSLHFLFICVAAQTPEELDSLVIAYYNSGEFEKALQPAEESLRKTIIKYGEKDEHSIGPLNNLAIIYKKLNQLEKAAVYFKKLSELKKTNYGATSLEYALSINSLAMLYDLMQQYEKAEPLYQQAITLLKDMPGEEPTYLVLQQNLADLYANTGKPDKAEPILNALVQQSKQLSGDTSGTYIESVNRLAVFYRENRQFEKAEPRYREWVEACRTKYGKSSSEYVTSIEELASLYHLTRQYSKAESLYQEGISIKKELVGDKDPDYAVSLQNLAVLYHDMARYDKAEPLYLEAAKIKKTAIATAPLSYANTANNLGLLYKEMEQFKKSETWFLEAMRIREKELGENHKTYAYSVHDLAGLYYAMGDFRRSKELYKTAIRIRKEVLGENDLEYARSLSELGKVYTQEGQYVDAENLCRKAMSIRKDQLGEESLAYGNSLHELAGICKLSGQYAQSENYYLQSLVIKKKQLGETHVYATGLIDLAGLYKIRDQYEKAESLMNQGLEIYRSQLGENNSVYAAGLHNLANLLAEKGEFEKAEMLFFQAITIEAGVLGKEHPVYAYSLNALAGMYKNTGQYAKAEPLFLQAIAIRKRSLGEEHPDYATSLNMLANLYADVGQYAKAEQFYFTAIDIKRKSLGNKHAAYAAALENLALLYISMKEYKKAEPLLKEGNEIWKEALGKNSLDHANGLNSLAGLYDALGSTSNAERLYLEALEIRKTILGVNHPDYASSLNNLATVYTRTNKFQEAEALFLEAQRIRQKHLGKGHPDYTGTAMNLALLFDKMNKPQKSADYLLAYSKNKLDNLYETFGVLSEKEKANYLDAMSGDLHILTSHCFNYQGHPEVIRNNFDMQLGLKSLALADTRKLLASLRTTADSSLQQLYLKWQSAKTYLTRQYSMPLTARNKKLDSVEVLVENIEKELTRRSAEFGTSKKNVQITAPILSKALKRNEAAVEFVRFRVYNKKWTDQYYYGAYILLDADSLPLFVPLCEEKQLQLLFDSAGNNSTSMVTSFYRGLGLKNKNASSLGDKLYKLIWSPLEPYLKNIKKVCYSPAGKLYSVAFHALPVDSTTVLMDKYALQQYTSTRQVALRNTEGSITKPGNIALFGDARFTMDSVQLVKQKKEDPGKERISTTIYKIQTRGGGSGTWANLPGTATEVKAIQQLFDRNKISTQSYVQTAASEENLKAISGKSPQILHIATHGFFLPEPQKQRKEMNEVNTYTVAEDPLLRTGLILAGGNYAWSGNIPIEGVEDGIITAYEISQIDLSNTELLVLSACETALGDVKGSEGVFGLQRAFKMAGVKKMIVSLWQVPDKETAELMTIFYTNWMKGKTIDEAFTQAQAEMRKKYSPFYWAAFVLVE